MTEYVTLVPQGGQPVRLGNQVGAPWPTTGTGALVFADGPTLNQANYVASTFNGHPWTTGTGTLTMGADLTTSGAYNLTMTLTANTNVTFPTSGTLATTGQILPYREATATPVTMTNADYEIGVYLTVVSAAVVTLPVSPADGQRAMVTDVRGDAQTNNITINGLINGGTYYVIDTNYGWASCRFSASTGQWNLTG